MLKISRGMETADILSAFGDSLIEAFPMNVTTSKKTKKVNLQSFRKAEFLENARIEVTVDGVRGTRANLLQVWCFAAGVDIHTHGLTRGGEVSPLIEAVAEYLRDFYPQYVWDAAKPQRKCVERVSLDALFA